MLPSIDYCSAIWDPYTVLVQIFEGRIFHGCQVFSRFYFQGSPHKTISCRCLSIIDHKRHQHDTACYGFSNARRFTNRFMYRNCAQSAVQNELKTGQFQQSSHAHLRETQSLRSCQCSCMLKPKDKTRHHRLQACICSSP